MCKDVGCGDPFDKNALGVTTFSCVGQCSKVKVKDSKTDYGIYLCCFTLYFKVVGPTCSVCVAHIKYSFYRISKVALS